MAKSKSALFRHHQFTAVTKEGEIVDIDDVVTTENQNVYCINCECKMIRKLGQRRISHFAHNYKYMREHDLECSYDLYLQAIIRKKLIQWYEGINELYIILSGTTYCPNINYCKWKSLDVRCEDCEDRQYNLKEYFPECQFVELNQTSSLSSTSIYRLYDSGNPSREVFLVFRACEDTELPEYREGQRTIVVEIEDECQLDEFFRSSELREFEEGTNVSFHGFIEQKREDVKFKGSVALNSFVLHDNGSIFIKRDVTCTDYKEKVSFYPISITLNPEMSYRRQFANYHGITHSKLSNWGMSVASQSPYNHKYCALCAYRYLDNHTLWCQELGDEHKFNENSDPCAFYKPDEIYIRKNLNEMVDFQKANLIEINTKRS